MQWTEGWGVLAQAIFSGGVPDYERGVVCFLGVLPGFLLNVGGNLSIPLYQRYGRD